MDKYSILRKLGQGTYGSVYLCEQKDTGRQCVMKRMLLRNLSEKERNSALQEAQLLESLNHPNIVAYVDTVYTRSKLYLLMQYCDGGDLERKLNEVRKENGMVPETQLLDWFVQMALALQYLHSKRILHRDLKTANVFLTAIGIVKLGDFGVSRVLSATSELAKTFVGTPYYLSPELLNNSPYGHASDVWALGVIFYELCTLEHPYEAKTFPALAQKILYDPPPLIGPKRPYGNVEQLERLSAAMLCKNSTVRPALPELLEYDVVQARMQAFVQEAQLTAARAPLTPHRQYRGGASPAGRSSFTSLESDDTSGSPYYAYPQAGRPLAEDTRAVEDSYNASGSAGPPAGRGVGEYDTRRDTRNDTRHDTWYDTRHDAAEAHSEGGYVAGGYEAEGHVARGHATGEYAAAGRKPRMTSATADCHAGTRDHPSAGFTHRTEYASGLESQPQYGAGSSVMNIATKGARSICSGVKVFPSGAGPSVMQHAGEGWEREARDGGEGDGRGGDGGQGGQGHLRKASSCPVVDAYQSQVDTHQRLGIQGRGSGVPREGTIVDVFPDAAVSSALSGSGGGLATPFKRGSRRRMSSSTATGVDAGNAAPAASLSGFEHAAPATASSAPGQPAVGASYGQMRPLTPDERLAEIDRKQRELQAQMSQLQVAKHKMEVEASRRASPHAARAGEPVAGHVEAGRGEVARMEAATAWGSKAGGPQEAAAMGAAPRVAATRAGESVLPSFAASSMPRGAHRGMVASGAGAGAASVGHVALPSGEPYRGMVVGGVSAGDASVGHAAWPSGSGAGDGGLRPTLPPSEVATSASSTTVSWPGSSVWPGSTVELSAGWAGPGTGAEHTGAEHSTGAEDTGAKSTGGEDTGAKFTRAKFTRGELPEQPAESVHRSLEEWNECFAGGIHAPRVHREAAATAGGGMSMPERDGDAGGGAGDALWLSAPMLETLRESSIASYATRASGAEDYEDDFESDEEDREQRPSLVPKEEEDVMTVLRRISAGGEQGAASVGGIGGTRAGGCFGSFATGQTLLQLEATVRQLRAEVAERMMEQDQMDVYSGTIKEVASRLAPSQAMRSGGAKR